MTDVQWVPYGQFKGPVWWGKVPATALLGGDFWAKAVRVVAAAEGGHVDMAQAYDAGILTAGPLGATARFGTLAKLLAAMPTTLLELHLGEMFERSGLGLQRPPLQPAFTKGLRAITSESDLRDALLGGSNGIDWNGEQMDHAEGWVRGLVALLTDPASHRPCAQASAETVRDFMTDAAAQKLGWAGGKQQPPAVGAVQQASACWLAFAINNPRGAQHLLNEAGATHLQMLARAAGAPGPWPTTFPQRVQRTRAALAAEQWP